MSRFLILSDAGDGVGLALRLKLEGHDARIKIFDRMHDTYGKGLVDYSDKYQMGQVVVADCTGFGEILDSFRDSGIPIFGGGSFADRLESDRQFAEEVMHRADIETPESVKVATWDDAAKQAERLARKSGKVVLKPEGSLSGVVPSYVAFDVEDALSMLKQFEKESGSGSTVRSGSRVCSITQSSVSSSSTATSVRREVAPETSYGHATQKTRL